MKCVIFQVFRCISMWCLFPFITFPNNNYFSTARDAIKKCHIATWIEYTISTCDIFIWAKKSHNEYQVVWVKEISMSIIALMLTEKYTQKASISRNIANFNLWNWCNNKSHTWQNQWNCQNETKQMKMLQHWLCPW